VNRGGEARLRIERRAPSTGLTLIQELGLSRSGRWLTASQRLEAETPLDGVVLGARLGFGGEAPFVPAPTVWDRAHDQSWVGQSGERVATAFDFRGDGFSLTPRFERHGTDRTLVHLDAMPAPRSVGPKRALGTQWTLAVTERRGLADAVRRLGWARGTPFPELSARVPYAPAGTRVHATVGAEPVIVGRPDATGDVLLPLPPGVAEPLTLTATAYGHASSDPVRARVGGRARLDIPRGGQLRVRVRGDGDAMAGRLRILGLDDTLTPKLGPDHRAEGAGDTAYTIEGERTVPLPPGRYRVLVSHGPEWTMHDEAVEVTRTYRPDVVAELTRVIEPGDWVGCDFHVHAAPSRDSDVSLRDRVTTLAAEGVRFAVATDHNHVTDYGPTVRRLGVGLGTATGVEVTTWAPNFGHFNAYPYPRDETAPRAGAPAYQGTTPDALFEALRAVDDRLVIQVNHPRLEPNIGYFDLTDYDPATGRGGRRYSGDYDVLEVFNGYDLARPSYVARVFSEWLAMLARGERVVANGSSDSHYVRFHWAGYPRTYVNVPDGRVDDPFAVTDALRRGRAFVTSGPFLRVRVGDAGLGDTATVRDGRARVHLRVEAPPFIPLDRADVYVGTEIAETVRLDAEDAHAVTRFDGELDLEVAEDSFLVVWVTGATTLDDFFGREEVRPIAFTNPIWLDADGDGRVTR
jgi:hypothetical protein